jgi:tetratricopeptide (TPR) repeat protein
MIDMACRLQRIAVVLLLSLSTMVQADLFTNPNFLIRHPSAQSFEAGELSMMISYVNSSEVRGSMQAASYYTVTNKWQIGASMLSNARLNASIYTQLSQFKIPNYLVMVGGGVLSLPNKNDNYNRAVPYVVSTIKFNESEQLHVGYGHELLEGGSGLYVGYSLKQKNIEHRMEYDDEGLNMLVAIPIKDQLKFLLGVKNIGNSEHSETVFALQRSNNLMHELQEKKKGLSDRVDRVSKKIALLQHGAPELEQVLPERSYRKSFDRQWFIKRITTHIREREFGMAISALKQSLLMTPDDLEIKMLLAHVYYETKQEDLFRITVKDILDKNPYYEGLFECDEQEFALIEELRNVKNDRQQNTLRTLQYAEQLKALSARYAQDKNYERAIQLSTMYLLLDPFDVSAYSTLSSLYKRNNQLDQSKNVSEQGKQLLKTLKVSNSDV